MGRRRLSRATHRQFAKAPVHFQRRVARRKDDVPAPDHFVRGGLPRFATRRTRRSMDGKHRGVRKGPAFTIQTYLRAQVSPGHQVGPKPVVHFQLQLAGVAPKGLLLQLWFGNGLGDEDWLPGVKRRLGPRALVQVDVVQFDLCTCVDRAACWRTVRHLTCVSFGSQS